MSTPLDVAQAQILKANLSEIGLGLEIKEFPSPLLAERLKTLGEPFDISRVGWGTHILRSQLPQRALGRPDDRGA